MSAANRVTYSVRQDKETGEWLTFRHSAEPSVVIARSATRLEALEVAWGDPFRSSRTPSKIDLSLFGWASAPHESTTKGK